MAAKKVKYITEEDLAAFEAGLIHRLERDGYVSKVKKSVCVVHDVSASNLGNSTLDELFTRNREVVKALGMANYDEMALSTELVALDDSRLESISGGGTDVLLMNKLKYQDVYFLTDGDFRMSGLRRDVYIVTLPRMK